MDRLADWTAELSIALAFIKRKFFIFANSYYFKKNGGLLDKRAQGTLEYLIILSVVLIIAIVVATQVLKIGTNTQVNEQESKLYWAAATPLSIQQYSITSAGAQLVLQNTLNETVTIVDFNLNGVSIGAGTVAINAGTKKTIIGAGVKCTKGDSLSYKVNILYNTESLSSVPFEGQKNLVGNCAG